MIDDVSFRKWRAAVRAIVGLVLGLLTLTACDGGPNTGKVVDGDITVAAEVIQLRRDQVLQRVEIALENRGSRDVLVERLGLTVDGFRIDPVLDQFGPIPAGQVVNLPVPYQGVDCPGGDPPRVGAARLDLAVHAVDDAATHDVRVPASDSGLLQRIANRMCAVERVKREVDLRFGDRWRVGRGPEGKILHGELKVHLRAGNGHRITQVAGAIMYGLRPDTADASPPTVLAKLTSRRPDARIPVVAYAARCDGHTIGEIKKPYEFLVWVSSPDGEDIAVTPEVGEATKTALRKVCAF